MNCKYGGYIHERIPCCQERISDKNILREEGFVKSHGLRIQFLMVKVQRWEHEVTNYTE